MNIGNVFDDIPKRLASELFEDLLKTGSFRLERIVSLGHSSPEGDWYDQQTSEWIYIVEGSAGLLFEGSEEETVRIPLSSRFPMNPCRSKQTSRIA